MKCFSIVIILAAGISFCYYNSSVTKKLSIYHSNVWSPHQNTSTSGKWKLAGISTSNTDSFHFSNKCGNGLPKSWNPNQAPNQATNIGSISWQKDTSSSQISHYYSCSTLAMPTFQPMCPALMLACHEIWLLILAAKLWTLLAPQSNRITVWVESLSRQSFVIRF